MYLVKLHDILWNHIFSYEKHTNLLIAKITKEALIFNMNLTHKYITKRNSHTIIPPHVVCIYHLKSSTCKSHTFHWLRHHYEFQKVTFYMKKDETLVFSIMSYNPPTKKNLYTVIMWFVILNSKNLHNILSRCCRSLLFSTLTKLIHMKNIQN